MYKGLIFDQDGTLYLGDKVLPGVIETLARLRSENYQIAFISNNPTKTNEEYLKKLNFMGIEAHDKEIINSSFVLVKWLMHDSPNAKLFVVGEDSIKNELLRVGFKLTDDPKEVDIVVASFDHSFNYAKLQIAFDAIRLGARFVGTNPDRYCPTPSGGEPDCAAMIAAIEACTGVKCDPIVGKPSTIMISTVLERLNLRAIECLIIGDRLETDIKMGIDASIDTCLVLTGDANYLKIKNSSLKPKYVIEKLEQIFENGILNPHNKN